MENLDLETTRIPLDPVTARHVAEAIVVTLCAVGVAIAMALGWIG